MKISRQDGACFFVVLATLWINTAACPPSDKILPCRCSSLGDELQIWCSYSGLQSVMEALKVMAVSLQYPVDELILESNNLPSLPGRTFEGLDITRLMLRDNGLERVTSNWLASLEGSLLELFIIEPRLRTLPHDALDHLRRLEAVTLQGGIMKRSPRFANLHKLRYIQLHSPVLTDLSPDDFDDLPSLEQLHVVGSPLLTKLDAHFLKNLHKLSLLNVSTTGLSWLHPKSLVNLPNLRELSLTSNRLSDAGIVGRACRDLQTLQILRLDNNYIDRILENSFVDLPSLREVYLSGNMISEIHRAAFRNIPSMKKLDLSRNLLRRVNSAAFMYPSGASLEELWMTDNQLYHVNELRSLFNSLPRLRFLDMTNNYMEEIPFDVLRGHPTLERLHLDENRIKTIPKKAFSGMGALRELRLRNNSISDFSDGPSWNLPSLKGLDLSQNKFRTLDSRLLTYLPSLRRLDLSENFIDTVIPDSFIGTLELETLNLSKNFITSFHALTFSHLPKLFELDVGWNRLREMVPGLPKDIEYLRLNKNQIFALPSTSSLDFDLPALRLLDLSGNSLQMLHHNSFRTMQRLQWLHLNDNLLQNIEHGALNGLLRLEVLNVRNNRIREFDNNALKGLKILKEIQLQGNYLETLPSDFLQHTPKLETMQLSHNKIADIMHGAFANARELQELDLSHNSLEKLPEALQGLQMLRLLDLSHNNIRSLQHFSFESLTSLSELRMSNNRIVDLEPNTFKELQKLEYLDMNKNDLEMIASGAFRSLPSIVAIRLSENRLTKIADETFVDLPELQSAEMQVNHLQQVADNAFVNVPNLALLNMSNNLLLGLEQAGIREMRSLEVLDLSHNKVAWLEGRSLQGMEWLVELKMDNNIICNIQGSPFNSLPRLRVLSLRHNRLTTVVEQAFQKLRNNIAVLDIDGNPLSCSCKMMWLQSWLKDTSAEGPRCADGTLFRETRLSRSDCHNSRVVEPVVPGCESEYLQGPVVETSQLSSLIAHKNASAGSHGPLPQETEYFYDEYVEYQYEEVNGTDAANSSVQATPQPPVSPLTSSHVISGDTPTIYARPNSHPVINISNPGLGYNDLQKVQSQQPPPPPYSGITFFGIPLPSLSLGNLWKGNAGRSAEQTQGRNKFHRGKVQPVTKTFETKSDQNTVFPSDPFLHSNTTKTIPEDPKLDEPVQKEPETKVPDVHDRYVQPPFEHLGKPHYMQEGHKRPEILVQPEAFPPRIEEGPTDPYKQYRPGVHPQQIPEEQIPPHIPNLFQPPQEFQQQEDDNFPPSYSKETPHPHHSVPHPSKNKFISPLPTSNGFVPMVNEVLRPPITEFAPSGLDFRGRPGRVEQIPKQEANETPTTPITKPYPITELLDNLTGYESYPPDLDLPKQQLPLEDEAVVGRSRYIADEIFRNAFTAPDTTTSTTKTPPIQDWGQAETFVNTNNWYFQNYNRTTQPFVAHRSNTQNKLVSNVVVIASVLLICMQV